MNQEQEKTKPRVVVLCGSTRFYEAFQQANYEETLAGKIVLSVGFFMHATNEAHGGRLHCTDEQKIKLDELHKRKIDLADEVLVLNVNGYIGSSTRSEIEYAKWHGKPLRYLEQPKCAACEGRGVANYFDGSEFFGDTCHDCNGTGITR